MSLHYDVLGAPASDNALWVVVDSGQEGIERLLFDCGEGCLRERSFREISQIDHLFFSHGHMDHTAGFDAFFRANYARDSKPNQIWCPKGMAKVLQHRFQAYQWNLTEGMEAEWQVHQVGTDRLQCSTYQLSDAFEQEYACAEVPLVNGCLVETKYLTVTARCLSHHGPCLAYRVDEKTRSNLNVIAMQAMGLKGGPWVQALKRGETGVIVIGEKEHDLDALRGQLLEETPGGSIAYLTDFLCDDAAREQLLPWLRRCDTLVAEAQYLNEDAELAVRHHHSTVGQVARLARDAGVGKLVLLHLSERYQRDQWPEFLAQARAEFPETYFPESW